MTSAADRRPGGGGGGRGYYRRGPPRRPRQQAQQDSQGEEKSEGNEGTCTVAIATKVYSRGRRMKNHSFYYLSLPPLSLSNISLYSLLSLTHTFSLSLSLRPEGEGEGEQVDRRRPRQPRRRGGYNRRFRRGPLRKPEVCCRVCLSCR